MNAFVSPLLRGFRRLLVLAAVFSGSAQAAVYTGVWDPPYGAPFSNLGWRGAAEFFVPDTCEPSGSGLALNIAWLPLVPGNCSGQAIVTSAEVELFNLTTYEAVTLNFNPSSLRIWAMEYTDGDMTNLATASSNYIDPTVTLGGAFNTNTAFSLFFDIHTGPRLLWRECTGSGWHQHCRGGINSDAPGNRPEFIVSRVPEPGTLALACLGLLAFAPRRIRGMLSRGR